jgi:hypothetical protein
LTTGDILRISSGHLISGGGLEAIVSKLAELLSVSGSFVSEVTVAVLAMTAPSLAKQLTIASIVILTDSPTAIESNLIVRLSYEPVDGGVEETKPTSRARLSVTITPCAGSGPRFVTVIV